MKEDSIPESLVSKSTLLMTFVSIQTPVVADIGSSEKKVIRDGFGEKTRIYQVIDFLINHVNESGAIGKPLRNFKVVEYCIQLCVLKGSL